MYTAACFLTDTRHVDRTSAMAHKGSVIKLLNEHIQSQSRPWPGDEAIAGVVQLIVDEWYACFAYFLTISTYLPYRSQVDSGPARAGRGETNSPRRGTGIRR